MPPAASPNSFREPKSKERTEQDLPSSHTVPCPAFVRPAGGSSSQDPQQAPAADVLQGLHELLQRLQQGGYICSYQLVWGSLPGGWPGDWAVSEPRLVDADDVLQQRTAIAPGSVFQVCVLRRDLAAEVVGVGGFMETVEGHRSRLVQCRIERCSHACVAIAA